VESELEDFDLLHGGRAVGSRCCKRFDAIV
jgi:hypothetical protein